MGTNKMTELQNYKKVLLEFVASECIQDLFLNIKFDQ